jgi:hypothetical protein
LSGKKNVSVTISEDLLREIEEWRQICNDYDLKINRGDFLAISALWFIDSLNEGIRCVDTKQIIKNLRKWRTRYYMDYLD